VSNYVFHWPGWISYVLLPVSIVLGFVAGVAGDAAKARRRTLA